MYSIEESLASGPLLRAGDSEKNKVQRTIIDRICYGKDWMSKKTVGAGAEVLVSAFVCLKMGGCV